MDILIVDDEPNVLESLERLLTRLGPDTWTISTADSGEAALQVMELSPIDLILTDMRMPGMDGSDLLTQVAARWPQVVRIAFSAEASEPLAARAAAHAHRFIAKPCPPEDMLGVLRAFDASLHGESAVARRLVGQLERVPTLPAAYLRIQALLEDPASDAEHVAAIVREDPSLTAKLLQLVNSAFFFRSAAVADVGAAVTRLGTRLIANLVLVEHLFAASPALDRLGFHDDAQRFFHAAQLAELVAAPAVRNEASLAALLCPVGRVVMIGADPGRAAEVLAAVTAGEDLVAAERRIFGASHAAIGGHLISLWGLPTVVATAVHHQHDHAAYTAGDQVLAAAYLANRDARGRALPAALAGRPEIASFVKAWDHRRDQLEGQP
jgi:HD-like signal output (HDOD) protein